MVEVNQIAKNQRFNLFLNNIENRIIYNELING